MLGVYITLPSACFRKGRAREYLETEITAPPSTCYGFLLSLAGETDRHRHAGIRVTPMMLNEPDQSVVLRTVWRVKKTPLGSPGNTRPDYQQILSNVEMVVWLDSREEANGEPTLEERVRTALDPARRGEIRRFGGLSMGESTHLVNEASLLTDALRVRLKPDSVRLFELDPRGLAGLTVWVDHVGSEHTRFAVGNLVTMDSIREPQFERMPTISP